MRKEMEGYIQVVTVTSTKEEAQKIAEVLLERRLSACVQILGPIESTYWWKDKRERAEEWLCLIKTRDDLYPQVEGAIKEVHSYEVPEIIALPITAGYKGYLQWMEGELEGPRSKR